MSDILITGLRSRAINVPLAYPVHTAVGTVDTAPLVLIDLATSAGVVGHSYLFAYTPVALRSLKQLLDDMAQLVVNHPLAPVDLEALLAKRFCLAGFTGLIRMAAAGIDMAAWDALAKAHDMPLVRMLGASARPVPTYDSHSQDGEKLATVRAVTAAEAGFRAVKTKIGYPTLDHDLAVVRSIRNAVGDDFDIMVDYNQSLDVPAAIKRGKALQDLGVAWIEEPTLQYDYAGHQRIQQTLDIPVQMGENWLGPEDMFKALSAGACRLAMPDAMKIGGVTGWLRASALAQQFGVPMSSHLFQEISVHLLAATPTAHWLERLDLAGSVIEPTLEFVDGKAVIPDLPGVGIIWREKEIERFLI
ncbi:Mandelate racemase [Pseudomonas fluorescens]|uniref:enolase C-terminal domain-like protein n=1 Tax=Pseudomonas fluorescens TaxID=294 RepID=UPI001254347C|nr:enolase C-terminal domain-like protein [Pseudomonas fluorescens]CAG8863219.1 Mandelate racemase [Pseudomonas fluorescens]